MNKLQFIKLLELRGIKELEKGQSIQVAVDETGGEATLEEMVKVNKMVFEHYMNENDVLIAKNGELEERVQTMKKQSALLECLEQVGVDNWEGYGVAQDLMEEHYPEYK